ncbi:ribonuclease HI [soil metagenome]
MSDPKELPHVIVFTDGGCRPNPGIGAWAAILMSGDKCKELVGGELETTNNRMEMLAAINALEALKKPCRVEFHTDSEYVKNGITSWIHNWKKKNWRTKTGPVKNVDLWQRLDTAIAKHDVKWHWVKGHSGHEHNERCDVLCGEEMDRMKQGIGDGV